TRKIGIAASAGTPISRTESNTASSRFERFEAYPRLSCVVDRIDVRRLDRGRRTYPSMCVQVEGRRAVSRERNADGRERKVGVTENCFHHFGNLHRAAAGDSDGYVEGHE